MSRQVASGTNQGVPRRDAATFDDGQIVLARQAFQPFDASARPPHLEPVDCARAPESDVRYKRCSAPGSA